MGGKEHQHHDRLRTRLPVLLRRGDGAQAVSPHRRARFTIGAMDDDVLRYWESGAPSFAERLAALKHAHGQGFRTSVSAEPMLDVPHAVELYEAVVPFVTDTIWFGKMNDDPQAG